MLQLSLQNGGCLVGVVMVGFLKIKTCLSIHNFLKVAISNSIADYLFQRTGFHLVRKHRQLFAIRWERDGSSGLYSSQ